jgi:hypothetical protein
MTEMTEFRCGGRGQLWSGNHTSRGREGRNLEESFVVIHVYVSSGGIFRIITTEIQELIPT